jgi:hypothetical protein
MYEGNWEHGEKKGKGYGEFILKGGNEYHGELLNNLPNGKGKIFTHSGHQAVGQFDEGRMENVKVTCKSGKILQGSFLEQDEVEKQFGLGGIIYDDGRIYFGNYVNGLP